MASEKLIAFILKAKQNKRNDEQIIQQLLSVGWKQAAIDDAFAEMKAKKITSMPAQAPQPQQPAATAPPWVKPAAQAPPQTPPPILPAQQPAAPAQPPVLPAQPSPAPAQAAPWVERTPQQPAAQAPPQTPPPILPAQQPAAPAQPSPAPAQAAPIELSQPPQKKSFLSSLFGKKQPAPQQPAQPAQPAPQQPAQPQATLSTQPAAQQPPAVPQGQSTIPTFAAGAAPQQATITPPAIKPPAAQAPSQPPASPSPQQPAAAPAKQNGMMKFLPIIALALIIAAAGAYYVFVMAPSQAALPATPSVPLPPPTGNSSSPEQPPAGQNASLQPAVPLDCGSDLGCLAGASRSCLPAHATHSATVDFLGMLMATSTYMEIGNTSKPGTCSIYMRTDNASARMSEETVAAALASGISMENITLQDQESTRQAQMSIGADGACNFTSARLSAMLERWQAGDFDSSDFAGAECAGARFAGLQDDGSAKTSLPNATLPEQPGNKSAGNSSSSQPKANATNATGTPSAPAANATTAPPAANATNATGTPSAPASFKYSHKYTSYYPEHLEWFCGDRDTEFYRMHWKEYFGSGCNVAKPKEGHVNLTEYFATGCAILPCCINGPDNEYSRQYDYFECGYN